MVTHSVRRARTDDAGELAELYAESLVDAYAGISLPKTMGVVDRSARAERFQSTIADGSRLWLVATEGQLVIGFCGLAPARDPDLAHAVGEVTTIAVSRPFRARGHGRALLVSAANEAEAKGCSELVLWVVAANLGARAFYERVGFREDGAARIDSRLGADARIVRYRTSTQRRLAASP
jgi:ribosomal protein S18 acetylase RimI-like enzyme